LGVIFCLRQRSLL